LRSIAAMAGIGVVAAAIDAGGMGPAGAGGNAGAGDGECRASAGGLLDCITSEGEVL